MPIVEVAQNTLSFQRSGAGEPLLLIMGMSGTQRHWGEPFLDLLRQDFEVITYDHRGVGESTRDESSFTIADLAADAAGLMDALELDSAHVMGISMGGMIAQELALTHPSKVRTLVLGCTYSGGEGSALAGEAVAQKLGEAMSAGDRNAAIRAAWEVNVSESFAAQEDAYSTFLGIGLHRPVPLTVIGGQMRAIVGHNTSQRLAEITQPTLVIHGTEDQMLPVSNGHMIAGLIPGARLEILDGVGHLFFWEQPARSAEFVREHASVHV